MGRWDVEDWGPIADRSCWIMFTSTLIVVILRLLCRTVYAHGGGSGSRRGFLGLDDYITMGCMMVLLATCIAITIGSSHGLGRRMASLEPAQQRLALKWNAIIGSIIVWTFSLPKFAIVAILKRILDYGNKTSFMFWSLALTSQACMASSSIWWFKQCSPIAYQWDKSIPGGSCASVNVMINLGYVVSAYSAFLDLLFALYPIPFIMRLNMPLRSRVAVSIALALSGLACFASIYKLAVFGGIFELMDKDPTYPSPYLNILGVAEGAILIFCASLPTLGPLFRKARDKYGSGSGNRVLTDQTTPNTPRPKYEDEENWSGHRGHRLASQDTTKVGIAL